MKLRRLTKLIYDHKTFSIILMTYVTILIIPLVSGLVNYKLNASLIQEQLQQQYTLLLEQMQGVLDERLLNIKNVSKNICVDRDVSRLLSYDGRDSGIETYNKSEVITTLNNYKNSNTAIFDICLYLHDEKKAVTSSSVLDVEELYHQYHYQNTDVNGFRSMLAEQHFDTFRFTEAITVNGQSRPIITYLQSLPIGSLDTIQATLMILLDQDVLLQEVQDLYEQNNLQFYAVNDRNQSMFRILPNDKNFFRYSYLTQKETFFRPSLSTYVLHMPSAVTDYEYVLIPDSGEFTAPFRLFRASSLTWISVAFFIGILIAYIISRRIYSPIQKIINTVKPSKVPQKGFRNGLSIVENATQSLLEENQSIRQIIDRETPILKSNLLGNILKGYRLEDNTVEALASVDIVYPHPCFAAVVVSLHTIDPQDSQELTLCKYAVQNIADELLRQTYPANSVDVTFNKVGILVNLPDDRTAHLDHITSVLGTLDSIMREQFDLPIQIAVGDIQTGLENAFLSYQHCLSTLEYQSLKGTSGIMDWRNMADNKNIFYYPTELELQLMNAVINSNTGLVGSLLDDLYYKNFEENGLSLLEIKCLYFDLVSTALKIMHELSIKDESLIKESYESYDTAKNPSGKQLFDNLKQLFVRLCEAARQNSSEKSNDFKNQLLAYIDKYCFDINFNLNSLAYAFHTNHAYLSAFFKEKLGINFTDYIRKIKTDKAKELLETTNDTLSEISEQLGYSNSTVFIRNFKKETGQTPNQYRESRKL